MSTPVTLHAAIPPSLIGDRRPILGAMLNPKSVAVIGATENLQSVGRTLMENLKSFTGGLCPVNPKRRSVLGLKAFPGIGEVPAPGFSAFLSFGSMLDVGWGDLIFHLADDLDTRSILIYMESIGDARVFLSAAREVALRKPIIVIKVGRTEAAAHAVASYTGTLSGSDAALEAAFRRIGVLRVSTFSDLFDMAEVLSRQPRPQGPRLTIVTNAGGPGVLATDMLVGEGGELRHAESL